MSTKRGPYQNAQEHAADAARRDYGPNSIPRKLKFNRARAAKIARFIGVRPGQSAPPLFPRLLSRRTKETFFGALNSAAQMYRHDSEFHDAQNYPAAVAQLKALSENLGPLRALLDAGPAYSLWRALAAENPPLDRHTFARFIATVDAAIGAALPRARKQAMAAKYGFPALPALACALMRLYEARSGAMFRRRAPGRSQAWDTRAPRFVRQVLRMIEPKAPAYTVERALDAGYGQLLELRRQAALQQPPGNSEGPKS